MNSKTFAYVMRTMRSSVTMLNRNKHITKFILPNQVFRYSTNYMKPMDVMDFFTDLILDQPSKSKRSEDVEQKIEERLETSTKVDQIIVDVDTRNPFITSKMLINELITGMETKNYDEVNKIINFCLERKIPLSNDILSSIAGKYSNYGLLEALISVRSLSKITNEQEYYDKGEFLHYLALCYWVRKNCDKCLELLRECSSKYPALSETTKKVLKSIIPQAVSSCSQAQMINVVEFTKEFTYQFNDYYPLSVCWTQLFLSDWFDNQELSNDLLNSDKNLQLCVSLLVPSLVPCLLSNDRINDIYRFLQILLTCKQMDAYSSALQILFDYYYTRRDRNQCGEIVKSSKEMDAPLREEQYIQFISWTVNGNPSKLIKKTEIEKIYSTF